MQRAKVINTGTAGSLYFIIKLLRMKEQNLPYEKILLEKLKKGDQTAFSSILSSTCKCNF